MKPAKTNNLIAGIVLISSSILTVFAMLHHPVAHSHNFEELVAEVRSFQIVNQWVHGGAIGLMMLMVLGVSYLGSRLGFERVLVRGAMVAFGVGAIAMVSAATVDGFAMPSFLMGFEIRRPSDVDIGYQMLRILTSINRSCALIGVSSMSIGILQFGVAALYHPRRLHWLGWLGVLAGASGCVGLYAEFIRATAHGMIAFSLLVGAWLITVGIHLIRSNDLIET